MSEGPPEFDSCAVCGRTILHGERVSAYVTSDGERAGVCSLCRDRAEAAGWLPAEVAAQGGGIAPRRGGGGRLRQRLRRYAERAGRALSRPRLEPTEAESPPQAARPRDPMRSAIEAFNDSHGRRKVAGLIRSLGAPRVSVRFIGRGSALITVAWDLSWYQWEVASAGGNGERVREIAKGSDPLDLSEREQLWNASVRENGALTLRAADVRA